MRFLFLTMDGNHNAALREAAHQLQLEHDIDLQLGLYDVNSLNGKEAMERFAADAARSDFIFGSMLFGEELVRPLQTILGEIETPVCIITSNPTLIRCTHIGKLSLAPKDEDSAPSAMRRWMKKLRPKKGGHGEGKRQLAMLRNLGKIMKFIPGKAKDLHTYISVHDYWMHASPENLRRMMAMFVSRYVPGCEDSLPVQNPIHYPDAAIYHPDADAPFPDLASYHHWRKSRGMSVNGRSSGAVGLLSLRTVILSGNTAHLDALIYALEARNVEVRAAYSAGLDFRPAIDQFYKTPAGQPSVELLLNGAGFSLVGGMAESRPDEARASLEALDVGYLDMIPLSFQRVEDWHKDDTGLTPMQIAMNMAIPELDGSAEPLVYGGPTEGSDKFVPVDSQVDYAANRIAKRVALKRAQNAHKKVAVVLFNFPPTLGNIGTAAYLDVFNSLFRLLCELSDKGYAVEVPESVDALRASVVEGNAMQHGTDGNVWAKLPVNEYRDMFPWHTDIEPLWGYAPGELLNDGKNFYVLGMQFGNVFVGIQPSFGYERDPMRLLMAKDAAPHHGFAAFYTWIEHVFGADAVIHFGTHGAMEFMPGKQAGMSTECWPPRLIGAMPNFYYYSVNNPSEATIAKRRGGSTLVSYMVPPLQQAGLYKGLRLLKDSIDSYRQNPRPELIEDIRTQAERIGVVVEACDDEQYVATVSHELIQVEHRMIPMGLHILGKSPADEELIDILALAAAFTQARDGRTGEKLPALPNLIAAGNGWDFQALRKLLKTDVNAQEQWHQVDVITREAVRLMVAGSYDGKLDTTDADRYLEQCGGVRPGTLSDLWATLYDLLGRITDEQEVNGLLTALDGGYIAPSPGNDVVRNPAVVPTGRNIHGLDPFRVPTPAAYQAGCDLVDVMLDQLLKQEGAIPETIAMVLWGTDNLKSDCEGVAQVLSLIGARAINDELGNVADVELLSLEELGRPRIDVVVTVSGIFRDLLRHQMNLIDKAVRLAADAPEPEEWNFIRKHTLAHAADLDIPFDEAAIRVYSNAPGNYGANVNHLVESSNWESDEELSEAFVSRKSYAYGADGWRDARHVMERSLTTVGATFQNIDSFEVGISDIDHYYEYLGGVTKSVEQYSGKRPPVLVADAISLNGRLSSLEQMVRIESRAKLLNPKWYEAMLAHGYEGVAEIETRVSNTYGWSATADAVEGWVYRDIATTFLLDEEMRERMGRANPHAAAAIARRLLEANARGFWDAGEDMLQQLAEIYGNLEDQMEGVYAS